MKTAFEVAPEQVELAKTLVKQVLSTIAQHVETFEEVKRVRINRLRLLDRSGSTFLETAMTQLERYQRLIPLAETFQEITYTPFSAIVDLIASLTPERQFCFVLLP